MITKINTFKILESTTTMVDYKIDIKEDKTYNRYTINIIDKENNKNIGTAIVDKDSYSPTTVGSEYRIDPYAYLRYVNVSRDYRGMGLAKILLKEVIKLVMKWNNDELYLYVSPDFDSTLDIEGLIQLYSSFGFELLDQTEEGADMVLEL